jgi:hypothetical protein
LYSKSSNHFDNYRENYKTKTSLCCFSLKAERKDNSFFTFSKWFTEKK